MSSERIFGPGILKILHPFKYTERRVMSSKQMKNSLTNCPPCLLAKMHGKGGKLSSRALKMLYNLPGAVYIVSYTCKAPLDQSDCWKLFVQL